MLGNPVSIPRYRMLKLCGDNAMGADNQQERLKTEGWITGFVDGEGCFSVSIFKNPSMSSGWQVFPEFVVTQGERSLEALQILKDFFGCGRIYVNRRHDNHREDLYRYCVRSLEELRTKIVPFFQRNRLRTSKAREFERFVQVLDLIEAGKHLTDEGLAEIERIIQHMNLRSRSSESSETVRRAPHRGEDTVRASGRPEEAGRKSRPPAQAGQ